MSTGRVKFYNSAKGFGFIVSDDDGSDVFVHVSAVERSGITKLGEGDQVSFEAAPDRRTGRPSVVQLTVTGPALAFRAPSRPDGQHGFSGRSAPAARQTFSDGSGGPETGVVKWFNPSKGFGFIQPSSGGGDVFVHISTVERAGLDGLADGQAVIFELQQDRRTGKPSATNLRLQS